VITQINRTETGNLATKFWSRSLGGGPNIFQANLQPLQIRQDIFTLPTVFHHRSLRWTFLERTAEDHRL